MSSFETDLMAALPPALHTKLNIGDLKISDGLVEVTDAENGSAPRATDGAGAATPALPTSTEIPTSGRLKP